MRLPALCILPLLTVTTSLQDRGEPFQPYNIRPYRLVNSVAFTPDGQGMYFALFHREVLAYRGRPDSTAPETGLYFARLEGGRWSEPELLPSSGVHSDYEPAQSPDGGLLLFNSKRPYSDGRTPQRNDLWMVEREANGWSSARPLAGINTFELEESYPSLDRERRLIFVKGPAREGGDDYDLYETRLHADGSVDPPRRLPFSDDRFGEGDPELAPDGSFLIFTRWDHQTGWQQTCDLYIVYRTDSGWGEPAALAELNTPRPDYGAAISPDGQWLYYRAGGQFLRRPLAALIRR